MGSKNKEGRQVGLADAAKDSAIVVAVILTTITSGFVLLWFAVTYRQLVIWAVTLGESFWGGVIVSVLGASVSSWAIYTIMQVDKDVHFRAIARLKFVACCGLILTVLAQCSTFWLWISGQFGNLSLLHLATLFFMPGCGVAYMIYVIYGELIAHH